MKKEIDHWAWSEITFGKWRSAVNQRLKKAYGITIDDSGADDDLLRSHWETKEAPYEFVEWFAIKYDLDPISAVTFGVSRRH